MEVVLPDPAPRRVERIFGTAVDSDGTPLVDATVRFGRDQARTDGSGRFELDVSSRHPGSPITVRATDGRFAVADAPSRKAALAEEGAGPVLLRLPEAVHALRGRVVDHLGRPMSQVRVVAMNATPIGTALGLRYEYSTGPRLEQHVIQTDTAGEFEVPFLRDRPYFMRFIDVDTMVLADVHDVRARDGELEVRLPTDGVVPSLEGRVLDDFGHPVPGAQVALHAKLRLGIGPGFASVWGRAVTADDQGRFAIRRAPRSGLSLEALPPEKDGRWAGVDLETPPTGAVELRVERSGEVVLDVPDDRVTRAVFFAPVDEALAVKELEPGRTRYTPHASRGVGGSFPLIRVSQRATTISLRDADGRELRRIPLQVVPGERVVVR